MRLLGRRSGMLYAGGGGLSPAQRAARYGLVAAWNLEDINDSFGANTLTNNNTTTFVAGRIGNAGNFVRSGSKNLSIADNSVLSLNGGDWWIACWANFTAVAGLEMGIVSKGSGFAAGGEYSIYKNTSDQIAASVRSAANDASSTVTIVAPVVAATWYFVFLDYIFATGALRISINAGTPVTDTIAAGSGIFDGVSALQIGRLGGGGSYMDGLIDAVAIGKAPPLGQAALSSEIRSYIYKAGNGRQYPSGWT